MQLTRRSAVSACAACAVAALCVACSPGSEAPGGDAGHDAGLDGTTDGPPACSVGIIGDPNATMQFQITAPGATADTLLNDGDSIGIALPPQGGRVVFLGVRATNIDACGVQLTGALRDLATQQVRIDARTVNLVRGTDGWGTSSIQGVSPNSQLASYANVPVCPNEWASTDIFDHSFQVEVTLQDRRGGKLTRTVQVVPKCVDDIQYSRCQCICIAGYKLGQACPDAGAGDGGDAGADAASD